MGNFAGQMRIAKGLAILLALVWLAAACGSSSPANSPVNKSTSDRLVGEWTNVSFKAQTMTISKQGETYIVELKNSQMPELNQKFAARYKDGVLHFENTQTSYFYDEKTDRLTGQDNLGKNEFKRK
jgi:ABC-type glycerol-3-phosphate transport system substrate-binding protein